MSRLSQAVAKLGARPNLGTPVGTIPCPRVPIPCTTPRDQIAAMVVYSFYVFDRHGILSRATGQAKLTRGSAECIYKKKWAPRPTSLSNPSNPPQSNGLSDRQSQPKGLSAEDDAKLVFGTIFSLRNMVRKLGGPEDKYVSLHGPMGDSRLKLVPMWSFISYRTGHYKLHYYETPTSLKFVMVTDTSTSNLRIVLHQIYVSLYVEYGRSR